MCGIAGLIWQDPQRPGDRAAVQAMVQALHHRGPDGQGLEVLGPATLGHARLKIIDLSEQARQPLSNEDGTVWLTFNGEIYNYRALRAGLEGRGHVFRSNTDSEVLVHLYEEQGADLVDDLIGMFAFAIWDVPRQTLLLARDRAGQKPLHYRLDPDALRFASEPGGLLADPTAPAAEPDTKALVHYLQLGYVPSPRSAFKGAAKLPPAHVLTWSPGGAPRLRRYWTPAFRPRSRADAVEELDALLLEAVELRLVSDVPLGAFLSGGVDSGLIVSAMARLRGAQAVDTFTIGFSESAYDERDKARLVANRYGTRHHEQVVPAQAAELLPTLVRHYGEPFADSSALPTYRLAEMTRRDVTVALSGDAGDELFAGYLRHTANEAARWFGVVPRPLRQALGALVEALPHHPRPHDPLRYAKRFLRSLDAGSGGGASDVIRRNAEMNRVIKPETLALLLTPATAQAAREGGGWDATEVYRRHFQAVEASCDDERVLWADFALYLPEDILVKVDIASMAHGLEARAPFLDHRLVEWAMTLPMREKSWLGQRKRILRRLARRYLAPEVVDGPKRGFAVPLDDWFRGELGEQVEALVLAPDARTRALLDPRAVRGLLQQHRDRRWDWHHELWAILWLEVWWREVLEDAARPAPVR